MVENFVLGNFFTIFDNLSDLIFDVIGYAKINESGSHSAKISNSFRVEVLCLVIPWFINFFKVSFDL